MEGSLLLHFAGIVAFFMLALVCAECRLRLRSGQAFSVAMLAVGILGYEAVDRSEGLVKESGSLVDLGIVVGGYVVMSAVAIWTARRLRVLRREGPLEPQIEASATQGSKKTLTISRSLSEVSMWLAAVIFLLELVQVLARLLLVTTN